MNLTLTLVKICDLAVLRSRHKNIRNFKGYKCFYIHIYDVLCSAEKWQCKVFFIPCLPVSYIKHDLFAFEEIEINFSKALLL